MRRAEGDFIHRVNPDQTISSVCAVCFGRAGSAGSLGLLKDIEAMHRCSGPVSGTDYLGIVTGISGPDLPERSRAKSDDPPKPPRGGDIDNE